MKPMAEKGKAVDQQQVESKGRGLLSNLRLSRATAIELAALGLVLAIAIILRVLPLQWGPYLNEYDPFFWYRIAEHIAKNGYASYFTWQDTLSWYPMGRDIAQSSHPGNPFSAVFIWQVLNAIQIRVSVYDVALYFPVLMAALTCIAAYYFGKDLGGKAVGIFTALFMAISPSYISRTVLGFFDTENIGIFGMVATGLFFLRSTDAKRKTPERVAYAVAGGLARSRDRYGVESVLFMRGGTRGISADYLTRFANAFGTPNISSYEVLVTFLSCRKGRTRQLDWATYRSPRK